MQAHAIIQVGECCLTILIMLCVYSKCGFVQQNIGTVTIGLFDLVL